MGTPKTCLHFRESEPKEKEKRWHQTLQDASARTGSLHRQRNIVHYNGKRGSTPLYIQNGARRDGRWELALFFFPSSPAVDRPSGQILSCRPCLSINQRKKSM